MRLLRAIVMRRIMASILLMALFALSANWLSLDHDTMARQAACLSSTVLTVTLPGELQERSGYSSHSASDATTIKVVAPEIAAPSDEPQPKSPESADCCGLFCSVTALGVPAIAGNSMLLEEALLPAADVWMRSASLDALRRPPRTIHQS